MNRDDEFRRYLDEQYDSWRAKKASEKSRTVSQMWEAFVTSGSASDSVKARAGWYQRWLEVRFDAGTKIVSLAQLSYEELTEDVFKRWIGTLLASNGRQGKQIGAGTVETIRLGVQAMFTYYLKRREIDRNPLRPSSGVPKTPGSGRRRTDYHTVDEIRRIAAGMPMLGGAILRHTFATASRITPIRILRKDQVDPRNKVLKVVVKGKKDGTIRVPEATLDEMMRLISAFPDSPFVYPNLRNGKAIPATNLYRWYHEAREAAGIPRRRGDVFHLARHGRATELLEETRNIHLVKEQLGHSRISTTEVYLHTSPALDAELRRALNKSDPSKR